jgi:spore coat protein A
MRPLTDLLGLAPVTLAAMTTVLTRRRALAVLVGAASTAAVLVASCSAAATPAAAPGPGSATPPDNESDHTHAAPAQPAGRPQVTPPPPSPAVEHFSVPLPLMTALQPTRTDDTTDYYELTESIGQMELLPGLRTSIWGYNGQFPGPLIRARQGRTASVHVRNQLTTSTVVHLHGGLTPAESDGFPMDLVPPGGERTYVYPNQRRAAMLWFHDHAMGATGRNIYMGLAGTYIVEDDEEAALGLPSGEFDIPLVLVNRQFTQAGELAYPDGNKFGATGDVILVNGAPWPRLEVARRKYRMRFLNASNSDSYTLALSSGKPLTQIATDGGLMAEPVANDNIPLAMAERAEVVIDFGEYPIGTQIVLQNLEGNGGTAEMMRFDVIRNAADDSRLPATLSTLELLRDDLADRTRDFTFEETQISDAPAYAWTINGQSFDPDRALVQSPLGDLEIWTFQHVPFPTAPVQPVHPVHVHLVNFRILDRNGQPPAAHENGWKDTVVLRPGDRVRVIMRFEGYRGKYLIHCHNLEHEDHAMMARFDVA